MPLFLKEPMRSHNFGAGPCTLPLECLEELAEEIVDYKGIGLSMLEISHRNKIFEDIHQETIDLAKEIYNAPPDFDVLFIQGGATLQFGMIPLNLYNAKNKAGYIITGEWSQKAFEDSQKIGFSSVVCDDKTYTRTPTESELNLTNDLRFLHITSNETISGLQFHRWPNVNIPMIADMSSDFFSRRIPWEKFAIVYGGVQKNIGPAGMAVVFINKKLCNDFNSGLPNYLRFDLHIKSNSLYNTPPVFTIYTTNKVLKWMKKNGGLDAIQQQADLKSKTIYDVIDQSNGYYKNPIEKNSRSQMNVIFTLNNSQLEEKFLKESTLQHFVGLKGHRIVGGCRASCYNALPISSANALAQFMIEFQQKNPL